ncbi:MAG: GNAT family N-acetyltransferase [Phycisphaerae bacterium]|nr:GNAT family N-acetyltransferase [Phycisphaerae bacterium]MDW8262492.1 GNAT family N-acetyltransferase [Phycisphaerales bacterium]
MLPRPITLADLPLLAEIDGTIESSSYLHLNRVDDELGTTWRLELRPRREVLIDPNRVDDELTFAMKQVVSGIDEGLALCIELNGAPAAALLAQPRPSLRTLHLLDLRVDFDYRRQGLGTALMLKAVCTAREGGHRALTAETRTDNYPAIAFLRKLSFEPAGLDTHRYSNHDLVKERATLLWCLALD